jgi:succinate dehydrogenase (ubiquinone) membrane anchor subunit
LAPLSSIPTGQVITDYVPVAGRMVSRAGLLGLSVASVAGLMKLNLEGPGITATIKKLWRP